MNIQELIAKLQHSCKQAAVERALLRAGERVRSRAVLLCPVNTGELRNSIKVTKTAPCRVAVGTNMEYAAYVEFGTGTLGDKTVPHTSKEKWSWQDEQGNWHTSHGTPAQPFLRPAANEKEIRDTVAAELKKAVDNA